MSPDWITLHVFQDSSNPHASYGHCEIDIRPSNILSMVELRPEVRPNGLKQQTEHQQRGGTCLTLNEPDDSVIENDDSSSVARGLRTIVVYETLPEIRALLGR